MLAKRGISVKYGIQIFNILILFDYSHSLNGIFWQLIFVPITAMPISFYSLLLNSLLKYCVMMEKQFWSVNGSI